jgi:chorismate mutase
MSRVRRGEARGTRRHPLKLIRDDIDRVDARIVRLLSKRIRLTEQTLQFKKTIDDIEVPARTARVLRSVRRLAKEHGIQPDIVERLYQVILEGSVRQQRDKLLNRR